MESTKIENFKPGQLKETPQAYTNRVYISERRYNQYLADSPGSSQLYFEINGKIFNISPCKKTSDEEIALGKYTRQFLRISLTETVKAKIWKPSVKMITSLSKIQFEVEMIVAPSKKIEVEEKEIIGIIRKSLEGLYLHNGQYFLLDYVGNAIVAKVTSFEIQDMGFKPYENQTIDKCGIITAETDIGATTSIDGSKNFKIKSSNDKISNLFSSDFKFEDLGIGGLDKELSNIFRRAFASRRFPPSVLKQYGIKHVKGILLYGPPGTGKTLIAKRLSKALRCKEPKIVNGPEILDKYVGEAEKNIRDLFKEARADENMLGDDSPLHVIIFDEFDSICKSRGTVQSGTGVHDSIVNQLLSMIDGVDSLNNILLIGMTNRKDLIDEAVMRAGRFEVHVPIELPNQEGRLQIFKIHTAEMVKNQKLGKDVSLENLSEIAKNYTGAEIEGIVKNACAFAFTRGSNLLDFSAPAQINESCQVEMQDFLKAFRECPPQFGADSDRLEVLLRGGMINYGPTFNSMVNILQTVISHAKNSKTSQLFSVLLEGPPGSGKTALAAWAARESNFPFVKLISPENFVGFTELGKKNAILKVFQDAYKSTLSCIILDNLERLIEYVDLGPRFSNQLLQDFLVLIKNVPIQEGNKLLIIGTTSSADSLRLLDLTSSFVTILSVKSLDNSAQIFEVIKTVSNDSSNEVIKISKSIKSIPIKTLILLTEMAMQFENGLNYQNFMECYTSYGINK